MFSNKYFFIRKGAYSFAIFRVGLIFRHFESPLVFIAEEIALRQFLFACKCQLLESAPQRFFNFEQFFPSPVSASVSKFVPKLFFGQNNILALLIIVSPMVHPCNRSIGLCWTSASARSFKS